MATNLYKGDSDTIQVTLGANASSGAVFVAGGRVAVLKHDGLNGETHPAFARGVFKLKKLSGGGTAWTIGTVLHWDVTNSRATKVAAADTVPLGVAALAAIDGATSGYVDINVRAPSELVAGSAGANPTQEEFNALIAALKLAGLMKTA